MIRLAVSDVIMISPFGDVSGEGVAVAGAGVVTQQPSQVGPRILAIYNSDNVKSSTVITFPCQVVH